MKKLLPVGSVVTLGNNGELPLMIFGYCPQDQKKKKVYEYIGVLWPFGVSVPLQTVFFDTAQIHGIVFENIETEKSKKLCEILPELMENLTYDELETLEKQRRKKDE